MRAFVIACAVLTVAAAAARAEDEDEGAEGAGRTAALVAPADPAQRAAWLRERFAAAVAAQPKLAGARIAYAAAEVATGAELVAREPAAKLNLASNAKVLTAVGALAGIGGGFRWRTSVHAAAPPDAAGTVEGDLYLRGRGDPTLSVAALRQLAHDVAARGVRAVEGKLVVDATYFDDAVEPPHFDEQPKERAAFRAPVASLGVARGAVTVTVMALPDGRARVTLEPPVEHLKLAKAEVKSVTEGRTRLRVEMKPKRDQLEIEVTGTIRAGEGSWDLRRRVDDPARLAAEVFRAALAEHGVRFRQRGLGAAPVPPTAKVLAHHDSAPLADVVRAMNKSSDNYLAESILKTLGAETRAAPGPATWADGLAALGAQLARYGLPLGTYRTGNGSGLFASTEVSPAQLVALLVAAHKDYRVGPDLVASLPVGGLDGTLARRWHGKPAQGRVRAKTGTLDKVVTLAGYLSVDGGRVVAFAILVNDVPAGQRAAARALADEAVDALAAFLGAT